MSRSLICIIVLLTTLFGARADAAEVEWDMDSEDQDLTLVLHGEFEGRLGRPFCRPLREDQTEITHLARQVTLVRQLQKEGWAPVVLNTGDLIFPGSLARFLLSRSDRSAALGYILKQMRYDAIALGNQEFAPPRDEVDRFFEAAINDELPLVSGNVSCATNEGAEVICEGVGTAPTSAGPPFRMITRNGHDIALISVLDPEVRQRMSPESLTGITLKDPEESLKEQLAQAEQAGADLTVVMFHVAHQEALTEAQSLATRLDGIDVMVLNEPPDERGDLEEGGSMDVGFARAARTGTILIGSGREVDEAVVAHLKITENGEGEATIGGVRATLRSVTDLPPDADIKEEVGRAAKTYCEAWGDPVAPNLTLSSPMDREEFVAFTLDTLRFATRTEIAFLNAGTLRNRDQFPLTESITRADITTLLPYENDVRVAKIQGKHLKKVVNHLGGKLLARGMHTTDGGPRINGRPIVDDRLYTVVLNAYLAKGGDGLFDPAWFEEGRAVMSTGSRVATIEDMLIASLKRGDGLDDGGVLSSDGAFPDLHRQFLWLLSSSVTASYTQINVVSPLNAAGDPAYNDQSQLTVNSTDQISVETRLSADADQADHTWGTLALIQFAMTRVQTAQQEGDFEETKDLIRVTSHYEYAGFQSRLGGKWWVPRPLFEGQLQSEFSPPGARDWRIFELTGIAGAKFRLFDDKLGVKLGVNLREDINDPMADLSFGFNVGYGLRRTDITTIFGTPLQVESELDLFFNDIATEQVRELRSTTKIYYAILDVLFFTTTLNAFAYRTNTVDEWGRNIEITIGLNTVWNGAFQMF